MRISKALMTGAVAAVAVAGSANASVLSFTVNWGPNGPMASGSGVVGLAVKVENGSASMQSITGAVSPNSSGNTYALPPGWTQQTLASSFSVGTASTPTGPSQYAFVRGGGGSTYETADVYGGAGSQSPLGFTANMLLDSGYSPADGAQVNVIWAFFKADGNLNLQGLTRFTFSGGSGQWTGVTYVNDSIGYWPWAQDISGTFNQLSAAVVPAPGAAALVGLAGLMVRRRRA